MDYKALNVGYVGKKGEYLQCIDECPRLLLAAADVKCEDGAAAVREILLVKSVIRMIGKRRMIYLHNLRMMAQILNNLSCVLGMTLNTKRQRLNTLKKQECVERGNGSAGVAKKDCANIGNKCSRSYYVIEGNTVVARVRSCNIRVFATCLKVELAGFYNNAAESRSVAAEELRCGMNNDVSAVLDRTNQVRSSEGVINYKWKSVTVCDFGNCVNVRKIAVGISESLKEDCSRIVLNGIFHFLQVSGVDKCGRYAVLRKRMLQKVEGAAVDGLLGYDVAAVCRKCLNRVGDCCCTGSNCQCCAAAFKCCDSFLKNALRRVGQTTVNVTGIGKTETVCCVLAVMEYICCSLVNRYCSRIGCGVCLFLSYM